MPHFYFATTPAWVIWLTQMRHVPYINEWYPIFESCHTSILLPHLSKCTQMGHFAHPNEACPHVQNTLICIYVDMYMYTYVNVFIHKMSQRCTFMYTRTMHIKMHICMYVYIYIYICTYLNVNIYMYIIHIYIQTYIHMEHVMLHIIDLKR